MAFMEHHGALLYHSMLNTLRSLLPASVLIPNYMCVATWSSTQEEGDHRMLKFNKLISSQTEVQFKRKQQMIVKVGETDLSDTRSMWQVEAQQLTFMERHGALPHRSMPNTCFHRHLHVCCLLPAGVVCLR